MKVYEELPTGTLLLLFEVDDEAVAERKFREKRAAENAKLRSWGWDPNKLNIQDREAALVMIDMHPDGPPIEAPPKSPIVKIAEQMSETILADLRAQWIAKYPEAVRHAKWIKEELKKRKP